MSATEIKDAIGLRYALGDAAEAYFGRQYRHEEMHPDGMQAFTIRDADEGEVIYRVEITSNLCPKCGWPPAGDGQCRCEQ